MPEWSEHRNISERVLGYDYKLVHLIMDWPMFYLKGRHRMRMHDVDGAIMAAAMVSKVYEVPFRKALNVALLHLLVDGEASPDFLLFMLMGDWA